MDRISTKGSMIDQIDLSNVPHSGFDRSFHNYMSAKLGKIVPTRVEEVLPGDRIKGSTHIVANFEPLVAPILGTMVMKQETFYVPQSILWKSAHNFFTGKKGFNNPILSLSMQDIYDKLSTGEGEANAVLILDGLFENIREALADDVVDTYWNDIAELTDAKFEDFLDKIDFPAWIATQKTYVNTFGRTHYVYDLVQPFVYMLDNFKYDADNNSWVGDPSYTKEEQKAYIEKFITDLLNFWFGPSSQCDYLGVGIYNMNEFVVYALNQLRTDVPALSFGKYLSAIPLNWLPFRAAYSVWYWNYRDQLLEPNVLDAEEFMETDDIMTFEVPLLLLLRVRCWFKDSFTTALTNTGNGNMVVPASCDFYNTEAPESPTTYQTLQLLGNTTDDKTAGAAGAHIQTIEIAGIQYSIPSNYLLHNADLQDTLDYTGECYISLDMLERAKRLSTWISKRLILGVEYDDVVYSSFMVKLSHVRMRVPELLDASRSTVQMNTIINNTTIPDAQVAGDKTAVAWAENKSDGVNYYAEEHGYLLSFMTVLPIQSYAGGIQRMYLRQNRFDFAWPEFAQMGFDAIYNAELATPVGGAITDQTAITVFGYQGRYYDYKSKLDEEHGRMRTDLNYMTFSRDFSLAADAENQPKLNYMFVHCWPALDMFVTDDPNVDIIRSIDVAHNYAWERVLPVPSETIR